MHAVTQSRSIASSPRVWRAVVAASIGNALEWFDLVVYGFFAVTISKLFFPAGNDTVSLLLTLGTFGVSFFMRPLGAIVLGAYADRAGRKAAHAVDPADDGRHADHRGAADLRDDRRRGAGDPRRRAADAGFLGRRRVRQRDRVPRRARAGPARLRELAGREPGLTTLLAAGFGTVLNAQLTAAQMASWGWRVPFFFGLLLGPVAYYIRTKVDETPEFLASEGTANPLRDTFASHKARLVAAMGVVVLGTVATYLVLFMPTYGVKQLGLAPSAAFAAILVGVIQMAFAPLVGHWSDTYGRVRVMIAPAIGILVLIYPAFAYLWSRIRASAR